MHYFPLVATGYVESRSGETDQRVQLSTIHALAALSLSLSLSFSSSFSPISLVSSTGDDFEIDTRKVLIVVTPLFIAGKVGFVFS